MAVDLYFEFCVSYSECFAIIILDIKVFSYDAHLCAVAVDVTVQVCAKCKGCVDRSINSDCIFNNLTIKLTCSVVTIKFQFD
jgi:hypothetical protein